MRCLYEMCMTLFIVTVSDFFFPNKKIHLNIFKVIFKKMIPEVPENIVGQYHAADESYIYYEAQTFNFLILLVCFAYNFTNGIIVCKDGVALFMLEKDQADTQGNIPRKVRVYFYRDKIYYWFNKCLHKQTHEQTVKYIYHIMSLFNVPWMNVILEKIYKNEVKSLVELATMKFPMNKFESTLSRYLTDAQILIRAFSYKEMFPLSAEGHIKEFMDTVKDTNMYVRFGKYMRHYYRRTIYMHQFYFYGIYSDWYNRYTLAYMLVMESILEKRHKWLCIDQNTHYCQIECYHIYLWRHRWRQNVF